MKYPDFGPGPVVATTKEDHDKAVDVAASFAETFKTLTKTQRETFEAVANAVDWGHSKRVLDTLLKKGLIVTVFEYLPGLPSVRVNRYGVPLPIHIAYCFTLPR